VTQEGSSSRHRDFAGALKRAALAALVAFGLFSLLVGIRTDTGPGGALELTARFETLAVLVAGCHRKGGGYLTPTPANASASR